MGQFDLDKWLVERYSPLTLERIKKSHFNYDDVVEILNEALRVHDVAGRSELLVDSTVHKIEFEIGQTVHLEYIKWLESKIEFCLEDKDLQREHWAFCKSLSKYRELALR